MHVSKHDMFYRILVVFTSVYFCCFCLHQLPSLSVSLVSILCLTCLLMSFAAAICRSDALLKLYSLTQMKESSHN